MLDTTIGVLVLAGLLRMVDMVVHKYRWVDLYTGEYGKPPKTKVFLMQLGVFLLVVMVVKVIMTLIMLLPFLREVGEFVLHPISENKSAELVVVMIFTPLIMNSIQFWVALARNVHYIEKDKQQLVDHRPGAEKARPQRTSTKERRGLRRRGGGGGLDARRRRVRRH